MAILYRFEEDGSFVAGDTGTGFASRLAATNLDAERAGWNAEIVAFEMVEAERQHAFARQGGEPVNEAIRENDARFMAALKAGLEDGSTIALTAAARSHAEAVFAAKEQAGPELSPSEIVQQAEARQGVRFDGWEVSHVIEWRNIEYQYQPNFCERLEDTNFGTIEDARLQDDYVSDFWTVYGHLPQGGVEAIEDFPSEDQARSFLAAVTGDRHADRTYPNHSRTGPSGDACEPLGDLMRALTDSPALEAGLRAVEGPSLEGLGEGAGGQIIDWPKQPDTYHGQRDQRAEEGRQIEPAARLLERLRTGMGDQGAVVTNYAGQERGGLEPGERVFLAPRQHDRDR
jgi:hypothetical protein